jgi:hypothetical protein
MQDGFSAKPRKQTADATEIDAHLSALRSPGYRDDAD